MTQVIKKCNEVHVGKTYPLQDLRTAESIEQLCEYVDAGHPIATRHGHEVRLLRRVDGAYTYDRSTIQCWETRHTQMSDLLFRIKLAPLAYRNDRPLHVGDKVKGPSLYSSTYVTHKVTTGDIEDIVYDRYYWRFADEVTV